ncbi:MAG: aldehyde dehydrogenase family protein [Acidimicrobiia bacterium]
MTPQNETLTSLTPGMPIPWGGDKVAYVGDELAEAFVDGDSLIVLQHNGELVHLPSEAAATAGTAVTAAVNAFMEMGDVSDQSITNFYLEFAERLADNATFDAIAEANAADVADAKQRGRSVTRLILSDRMRAGMIEGLSGWALAASGRGAVVDTIDHDGWHLEQVIDGLGVIGFVFEGRPNVFADATGVLRGGNTVVFRIGSDALGTASAIVKHALDPALAASGLPQGAASLVASRSRASGLAMMNDPRLSLAVARGSGEATTRLGAVARQAGNAVSLHGTGGAWIVAGPDASGDVFGAAVYHSLDRKVCNTVNTVCVTSDRAEDLVPALLHAMEKAAERRGVNPKVHVTEDAAPHVPSRWFDTTAAIARSGGDVEEPLAEMIGPDRLGEEWEWEDSPEITIHVVDGVSDAVKLFNTQAPRFVASLISEDQDLQDRFFATIDAPFVGTGFTRWVDGQYALNKPELGLSNWQNGRLFGRSGILSGDSAYSVRMRATQTDPDVGR